MGYSITRIHTFEAGHRVCNHESKCANLHGHSYQLHATVESSGGLDVVGRVVDFSVVKDKLCEWIDRNWDHRMLIWTQDPWFPLLVEIDHQVVAVPCNPTAENLARFLVETVGPAVFRGLDVSLISVTLEETRKCSATYRQPPPRPTSGP